MRVKIIWFFILIIITGLASCDRAKDKVRHLIDKSVNKAKETVKEAWVSAIDITIDALTTTKKSSFQNAFGSADSLNVQEIDGLWIDMPAAFYYCFLKYKADKYVVLRYISSQSTVLPDISDSIYFRTDTIGIYKNLRFIEKEYPGIKSQLKFFYELKDKSNLEFYECSRYPNAHYMVYDPATGIIYHHFEKYWD